MRRHFAAVRSLAAILVLVTSMFITGLSSTASAAPVAGAACQPGQGVTVAVDFSLDGTDVDIRCAVGASGTIYEAFQSAGFVVTGAASYVTAIDGVDPAQKYGTNGFWGLYTSTVDGRAAGAPGTEWKFAQVGAGDGPVKTDQAYIFRAFQTWDCMMLDSYPNYPVADPEICVTKPALADLIALTGTTPVPPGPAPAGTANPDAKAGAAWIAAQLAAGGDVAGDNGVADWGLTIDALYALMSAHVAGDQIAATAAKLYASDTAYIGAASDKANAWPKIAKTVLALVGAGLDPTAFPTGAGPRNLIADLRSVLNADGSFGAPGSDSVFSHPLAMLALSETNGSVPPTATAWLVAQSCTDAASPNFGSYGWSPDCSAPDTDSTAMVLQALAAAGVSGTAYDQTAHWLLSQQGTDGGFASWGAVNTNTTGIASQAVRPADAAAADKGAGFIAGLQISCSSVAAHPKLKASDVGAIAYDQAGFDTGLEQGIGGVTSQYFRATVQAVLGLGGPGFAQLTAAGADPAAGKPGAQCPVAPEPRPGPGPGPDPGTGNPPVSANPSVPAHPQVSTGGYVVVSGPDRLVVAISVAWTVLTEAVHAG